MFLDDRQESVDVQERFDRKGFEDELLYKYKEKDDVDFDSVGSPLRIFVPVIASIMALFFAYSWYTEKFVVTGDNSEIPLVMADKSPVRVKPDDPGGMLVPDRDKDVYNVLSGKDSELPVVTRILPPPEEVVDRELIGEDIALKQKTIDDLIDKVIAVEERAEKLLPKQDIVVKIEKTSKLEASEEAIISPTLSTKVPVKNIEFAPMPIRKKVKVADARGKKLAKSYKLQLGSYRSESEVRKAWSAIKSKYKLLGDFALHIEKADLGKKGVFYRLKAGTIKKESKARDLCKKLVGKGQACFVTSNAS